MKKSGFTLIELLVVIAIIALLAGLLLPALARTKVSSGRAACANNLRQVNLAIRLYADDHDDRLPCLPTPNPYPNGVGAYYKELVKGYLGLSGPARPGEKVFACPADRKLKEDENHAFTSFTFNGYEVNEFSLPRITGKKLPEIRSPARAVMVGEWTAFSGGSWHPFEERTRLDAKSQLGFVDGHVANVRIYWNGIPGTRPCNYEPPAGYEYSWSGGE
jgi:prepilin-type N-terminal cleavage/methylation domain-containing protein